MSGLTVVLKSIDDFELWVKLKLCEAERNRVVIIKYRNMEMDLVACRSEEGKLMRAYVTPDDREDVENVVHKLCAPTKRPTYVIYEVERDDKGVYRVKKVYEGPIL